MFGSEASVEATPDVVRLATQTDEIDLMDMVHEMHQEAGLKAADGTPLPLDDNMARAALHRAIIPNRNMPELPAFIGIMEDAGAMVGSIYLSMETTWYSPQPIMVERWLYVRAEHRRSTIASTLIDFAKKSADAANTILIVGHLSSGREEAKSRFYRRHLKPLGAYYMHQGSNGAAAGAL